MIVIRVLELAGHVIGPSDVASGYLKSFDPEAHDGQGDAVLTDEVSEAMKFDTFTEAYEFYHSVPMSRPIREDGRPNRPLTAFTVSVETLT